MGLVSTRRCFSNQHRILVIRSMTNLKTEFLVQRCPLLRSIHVCSDSLLVSQITALFHQHRSGPLALVSRMRDYCV
jgi:hypothetical protein